MNTTSPIPATPSLRDLRTVRLPRAACHDRSARRSRPVGVPRRRRIPIRGPLGVALLALMLAAPALSAQERVEARHDLTPNARLSIGAIQHDITVQVWDRNEVEVIATIDPDVERLEVEGQSDNLSIRIERERDRSTREGGTMELRVPRGVRLTVSSVSGDQRIENVTGAIRLSSVSGDLDLDAASESAELNSVSGDVLVTGSIGGANVNTVSGDAEIRGIQGSVELNTVSGDIFLEADGALERIRAQAVSGDIRVDGTLSARASVEMDSHSGDLTLRIPAGTSADYELDTMSGRIENGISDAEVRSPRFGPGRSLAFVVGDGSARVRLQSFSGSVTLERR